MTLLLLMILWLIITIVMMIFIIITIIISIMTIIVFIIISYQPDFFSWRTTVKIKVPACVVPSLLFDIYCIFLSWLLAKVCLSLTFCCSCTFPLVTVINGYVFIWYFIYLWWWSITHILNKILYLIQVLHLTYFFSLLVHNDVMTSNLWL